MKRFLLFFLLLSSCKIFSQTDSFPKDSTKLPYDTLAFHSFYVKTNPFTLLDLFNGGSLNLTVESFPVRRISVSPEMGFFLPINGMGYKHLSGWRSGLEIRYYYKFLYDSIGSEGQFIGIRYLHKTTSFTAKDSIDLYPNPDAMSYKLTKMVEIGNFVWGLRYQRWHGMEKEFYMGVGVRYKDATSDALSTDEAEARYWEEGDQLSPRLLSLGETISVDFLIGMKFGFGLK